MNKNRCKILEYIAFGCAIAIGLAALCVITGVVTPDNKHVANAITTTQPPVENYAVEITINQSDVNLIAKTVYGEARGCSIVEQSAVVWCILNRVDAGYGTIEEVITAKYQFTGYNENNPVEGEFVELAIDVLLRWQAEKYCIGDVGRTLPDDYLWFHGDGKQNHFRNAYSGDYDIWDWNCLNPYP